MNMTPLISIIVPVYKVEKYLRNCVGSILNQSYSNWELILVDDGSPDKCPEICDEYALNDKRIQVLHKSNGGLSSARNAALDVMKGDYVTCLDSDDFWHKDFLKDAIFYLNQYDADLFQCGFIRGMQTSFPISSNKQRIDVYDSNTIFTTFAAKTILCAKLFKSALFKDVRMPVGKVNEDDFTTWKLYYRASRIVVTDKAYYYYTVNPTSITRTHQRSPSTDFWDAYNQRILFFKERNEDELVVVSKVLFCNALIVFSCKNGVTEEQRNKANALLNENVREIRKSKLVPVSSRILFTFYYLVPSLSRELVKVLLFFKALYEKR